MSTPCPSPEGERMVADVVVVGAGPAGSTTAAYLADRGLDVVLLEKASLPRDKVCGDGLTPRAVTQLIRLGVDISDETAWPRNKGLRVYPGRRAPLELPWPQLADFPPYGLVRRRRDFDQVLAAHAVVRGARLFERTRVVAPLVDERTGRVTGVRADDGRVFLAPVVVAADGGSSRLGVALGLLPRPRAPMGVAVRTYFTSPRTSIDYMESWLDLRNASGRALPGYGWVFGLGDGTCNVGLGVLDAAVSRNETNYRALMREWLDTVPASWGFTPAHQDGPVGSAALPMAFNRQPAYARGVLLVGDSGGMISPFNGEGIAYAMEAGQMAADAVSDAFFRGVGTPAAERALEGYPSRLKAAWGGYFRLGEAFAALIGRPQVMHICTRYGIDRPVLMRLTMKLLSHLYDTREGDWMDKVLTALTKLAGAA